jgi:hypothetical protein
MEEVTGNSPLHGKVDGLCNSRHTRFEERGRTLINLTYVSNYETERRKMSHEFLEDANTRRKAVIIWGARHNAACGSGNPNGDVVGKLEQQR